MNFEEVTNLIKNRRSIFPHQFSGAEITRETLEQILENANYAPTHKLTEPWRFKILRGSARQRLADFLTADYKANTPLAEQKESKIKKMSENPILSSSVVAICVKHHPDLIPEWEEIAAVAMAVQNLWLSCAPLGIGGYWSSPAAIERIGDFLQLEENELCMGFFYMGYTSVETSEGKRKPMTEKIVWLNE
ncbi:MAG: nitroreductase [Saprospiraceae bacterium]|nr:nitroreductase [Saprospiraceae bacterium]